MHAHCTGFQLDVIELKKEGLTKVISFTWSFIVESNTSPRKAIKLIS